MLLFALSLGGRLLRLALLLSLPGGFRFGRSLLPLRVLGLALGVSTLASGFGPCRLLLLLGF